MIMTATEMKRGKWEAFVFSACCWMWARRAEGWHRWVSQKDHLSCVRGSMEREGDSDGDWLLLSSPFKLFLHTGHVSCCLATEQNIEKHQLWAVLMSGLILAVFNMMFRRCFDSECYDLVLSAKVPTANVRCLIDLGRMPNINSALFY